MEPGVDRPCAGVGLIGTTLHGDGADPHVAWLMNDFGRLDVTWPPGYRARFTPRLEILDGTGRVVLIEGSTVDGGCVTGDPSVLHLEPPFR